MASIEMKNIVKQYGDGFPAVNDVSLDIADGEFMILVGPSGCGKSTLLRMIVGLEDITSGDMIIGGKKVNDLAPRDRNLSMVFQNYALYPHMTVYENIAFPLRLSKTPDDEVRRRVTEASDVLELKEHLERKPANLSGGQRQRVAMGRAIVRQAEAFLFDEPLSNLDAKLRGQMRTEISRLQRRLGITTVYVTHDQTEAMTLGDRVCVLRKGKIQQVASPRELYEQPVNLFVAGFIGSPPMNFLPATPKGNGLETPFGTIELDEKRMGQVKGRDLVLVGIRPEYFDDASLVDDAKRAARLHVPGTGRRHRVAGRLAVRLHPVRGARGGHRTAARARPGAGLRGAAHPGDRLDRLHQPDPGGPRGGVLARQPEGARLRPAVGGQPDPRRRGRCRAHPAGDAGPGGAGGGVQGPRRAAGPRSAPPEKTTLPPRLAARRGPLRAAGGGVAPSSTRSTCAASPTPTATGSATSAGCAGSCRTWPTSASTRCGSRRGTRRRWPTAATTSATTATSIRGSARSRTPTPCSPTPTRSVCG